MHGTTRHEAGDADWRDWPRAHTQSTHSSEPRAIDFVSMALGGHLVDACPCKSPGTKESRSMGMGIGTQCMGRMGMGMGMWAWALARSAWGAWA